MNYQDWKDIAKGILGIHLFTVVLLAPTVVIGLTIRYLRSLF